MKKIPHITICEGCDPEFAKAIKEFERHWKPYSTVSRRYPILRLIHEIMDPAVATYMKTLPARYSGYVPGSSTGTDFSEIIRLVGLDAMVRLQRQMLHRFILTIDKQDRRDQRFIATIESLTELVWDCACKLPKKSIVAKGVNQNIQRKCRLCELCGEPTELTFFMATVSEKHVNDSEEVSGSKRLNLSNLYCAQHRPLLEGGERNTAYRQAKRAIAQFELELGRINRQCAHRNTPQAASGDPLVDGYFYRLFLAQTVQPADKSELRNQARLIVDAKLSDRKKQILRLQSDGLNQSEIARHLGLTRQTVSKALGSVARLPKLFQLKE